MFSLPKTTEIKKVITKKIIYDKFKNELSGEKKKLFDDDISRIVIVNEISPASVNIKEGDQINSIFVVQVELKKKEFNERSLIFISKLFGQKIVLVLKYNEEYRLAIYQTKMLYSSWIKEEDCNIEIKGLTLDAVWDNIVTHISGITVADGNSLDEQIALEEEKQKLRKQIEELEKKSRKEVQSKKKFEMFQRIKEYKKKLEEM